MLAVLFLLALSYQWYSDQKLHWDLLLLAILTAILILVPYILFPSGSSVSEVRMAIPFDGSFMRTLFVRALQLANVVPQWGVLRLLPFLPFLLPLAVLYPASKKYIIWFTGAITILTLADRFQPFKYVSVITAVGWLILLTVGIAIIAKKRYPTSLPLLIVCATLISPIFIVLSVLPDSHQFITLPFFAFFFSMLVLFLLFCFQVIQATTKGLQLAFYSFALVLFVSAIAEARFFVVTNHEVAALEYGKASSRLRSFLAETGNKGAYLPAPNAAKTTSKILGLEFQSLSGKYFFTDVSNYAIMPDSLLIDKQPFVRIMPFYKFARRHSFSNQSVIELRKNFLAYSDVDLLLVHHTQINFAREITNFAKDSLDVPELDYTIFKLK